LFHHKGRLYRASLPKWANRESDTKAKAQIALEEMRRAVREGGFDQRGPTNASEGPLTFRTFAELCAEKHVKLGQEDNKQRRRVSRNEEAKLLAAAPPRRRAMIVAALDTGTWRGEMFALRFDIDLERSQIALRGTTTKSGKTRHDPISTLRLRAVFERLRRALRFRNCRVQIGCRFVRLRPASAALAATARASARRPSLTGEFVSLFGMLGEERLASLAEADAKRERRLAGTQGFEPR
jgi:hypothetical protein